MTLRIVSLSGGKDSTAVALLARDLGPEACHFVFADTGNEHELTMRYVYDYLPAVLEAPIVTVRADFSERMAGKRAYIAAHWPADGVPADLVERAIAVLVPSGIPFLDLCLWKGRFPSRMAQFCTQELKRRVLDAYLLEQLEVHVDVESWRGIRRDESQNRKDAKERESTPEGYTIVHPIVDWTAQRVVDFVRERGLELNPLYKLGMGRVGCMPCINVGKDELLAIATRFPGEVARIREWESLVSQAAKRGASTFFCDRLRDNDEETSAEAFERLRVDKRIEWAKTSRGGAQLDMLRAELPPPGCSSMYGLCE